MTLPSHDAEKRAVEAAKAWFIDREDPIQQRVRFALPGSSAQSDFMPRLSYALGYLAALSASTSEAAKLRDALREARGAIYAGMDQGYRLDLLARIDSLLSENAT